MSKRSGVLALLLAAAALAGVACYDHHGNRLHDPLSLDAQLEKVRLQIVPGALNIGALVATGADDTFGAFLAADQATAAGKPVNIVFMDATDYPPGVRDTKLQAMVGAGLQAILTATSGDMLASYSFGAPAGVLSISNGATSTEITSIARPPDLLFRTCPTDAATGKILARLAFDDVTSTAGVTGTAIPTPTAAIIYDANDSYALSIRAAFRDDFIAIGGRIVQEASFDAQSGFSDASINAAIAQVFAPGVIPDRVILAAQANPDPASTVVISWTHQGSPTKHPGVSPWIFVDAIVVPLFINNIPGAVRGAIDGSKGVELAIGVGPGATQFRADFPATYGRSPATYVSNAYDAVALLALADARARGVSGTASPTGNDLAASLRPVANGPGTVTVSAGVASLTAGFQALAAGQEVKYAPAYSGFGLNANGELKGQVAFQVVQFNAIAKKFSSLQTIKITLK